VRESPAKKIIEQLEHHSAKVYTFDPHLKKLSNTTSLSDILKKSTALILATDHRVFRETITPALLVKHGIKVFIDGKNAFDKHLFRKAGIIYKGIGR
ncbi:MAG: UDP binding domain-containing protein, partial [Candidatus Zixiibacteriota bacterium]